MAESMHTGSNDNMPSSLGGAILVGIAVGIAILGLILAGKSYFFG